MRTVQVDLGDRSYQIEIGRGNLRETRFTRYGKLKHVIVTGPTVAGLYRERLKDRLLEEGLTLDMETITVPEGEENKTWETAGEIGHKLLRRGHHRKTSLVIAVGGGRVTDVAGFAASVYGRGMDYVNVPTTLLGQVDAAIGGKTGVNAILDGTIYKNMFGHIHQPRGVIIDVETLGTLPPEELGNGFAEVAKYGMTMSQELFEQLEHAFDQGLPSLDDEFWLDVIEKSCALKAGVVMEDEKDTGKREILNYGHTYGHAIEADGYPHGEAVAKGMAFEAYLSHWLGILPKRDCRRQNTLLKSMGFNLEHQQTADTMIARMRSDKKGGLYFVQPTGIGEVKRKGDLVAFHVDKSIIRELLTLLRPLV